MALKQADLRMSLSKLPLSYCTNVHPGRSVAEVEQGLDRYTLPVRENYGGPLAAGLWLAQPVVAELLQTEGGVARFAERLYERGLVCYTLNAFPFGDFHSARVKEQVYLPDWTQPARLEYTLACARVLAQLLPPATVGSISTVPLGFKPLATDPAFTDRCADALIELVRGLSRLHEESGRLVRLAIEPEPFCVLETTGETLEFFAHLHHRAELRGLRELVRQHIGVCYDVCHQAVEFEDVAASIAALVDVGIAIAKVHITCALELQDPLANAEGRAALARYVEPRYLHQTIARAPDGRLHRVVDLTEPLALDPPPELASAEAWRVHFHVPVNAERLGPLGTTRPVLRQALAAVAQQAEEPHLEVETYTWEVLPGDSPVPLVDGLTEELVATRSLLESLGNRRLP